ncbi:hypothetical protein YYG_02708 [Plasmodium vinckei petteri]|uniref:HIT-type domain-containing protein n=1 Tax=Plasmodium vinckei petteri TaxID=138298 RepID=W7AF68_PLAVN|nr:hypothetical protein YYG_02708 [Plasmodium vinckei petteri]CAD2102966.1 conserved Plasmodium protein, unknown function [Plasmodium vinckei petteri]
MDNNFYYNEYNNIDSYVNNFTENAYMNTNGNYENYYKGYNEFENEIPMHEENVEDDSKVYSCPSTGTNNNPIICSGNINTNINNATTMNRNDGSMPIDSRCTPSDEKLNYSGSNNGITQNRKRKGQTDESNNKKHKRRSSCIICSKNTTKYKFACCREYYCSLVCYRTHNTKDCFEKNKKNSDKTNSNQNHGFNSESHQTRQTDGTDNADNTEPVLLSEEQKNRLKGDLALRLLLKNNYVRSIFKQFTISKDKITYLSHYINDPTIVQVIDHIMKTIDC